MPWTRWYPNQTLLELKGFQTKSTGWLARHGFQRMGITVLQRRPVQNRGLLVTQGHYGIDTRRTAGWDVAGKNRR